SQRRDLRATLLALVAGLACLGELACFDGGEAIAYAPCESSEACRDAGLVACVIRPDVADAPGFCAPACDDPCPAALDGDAPASCMTIDDEALCVLDCDADITCPSGQKCRTIRGADGEARGLCFPVEEATP
ncbi:MAG: hypothetical protein KC486_35690, partial [Myxococcales bacterium]|nr:hypothetical protein [Myxococcales bacterium]